MTQARHVPVLLGRVLELLGPPLERADQPVVLDATLGLGGHTEALLETFPGLRVIGIDRDPDALALAKARLAPFADRVTFVHAVYDQLAEAVAAAGLTTVDGVLFDLGVSSMQLDRAERGFAYAQDAPLDMRMNPGQRLTAADVLNTYDAARLARILSRYGEEKFARRIAERVVAERSATPFETSGRLVDLIRAAIPAPARRTGGNPAKRTFQALRIEVNDELGAVERAIPAALDAIGLGGRVVVLAYHSLEDRIVKRAFAAASADDVPAHLPMVPAGRAAAFRLITRGAEQASPAEVEQNPRAKPVRLRCIERVAA